jgi:hypothetical protein
MHALDSAAAACNSGACRSKREFPKHIQTVMYGRQSGMSLLVDRLELSTDDDERQDFHPCNDRVDD